MNVKRWHLPVIALNAMAAVVVAVTLAIGAPRMPKVALAFDVPFFALACFGSCVIANVLASNGRSKALIGLLVSWLFVGTLVSTGVGLLYGNWAKHAVRWAPTAIMFATVLIWRDWFRDGGAEAAEPTSDGD